MKSRLLHDGEIVKATDEISVPVDNTHRKREWVKVPALYVGKEKRILSNPIRRCV